MVVGIGICVRKAVQVYREGSRTGCIDIVNTVSMNSESLDAICRVPAYDAVPEPVISLRIIKQYRDYMMVLFNLERFGKCAVCNRNGSIAINILHVKTSASVNPVDILFCIDTVDSLSVEVKARAVRRREIGYLIALIAHD